MTVLRLLGLSGSTRRPSKTTALVDMVGARVAQRRSATFALYDLASIGAGIGAFSRDDLPNAGRDVLDSVEAADALIVGSPIYKGAYCGLFKHLIDFVEPAALVGKPVVLVATGGGRRHALAIEHAFRPLFGFFSALTMPTAVYAADEDFVDGVLADPVTLERVEAAAAELAQHAKSRPSLRPVPLDRVA